MMGMGNNTLSLSCYSATGSGSNSVGLTLVQSQTGLQTVVQNGNLSGYGPTAPSSPTIGTLTAVQSNSTGLTVTLTATASSAFSQVGFFQQGSRTWVVLPSRLWRRNWPPQGFPLVRLLVAAVEPLSCQVTPGRAIPPSPNGETAHRHGASARPSADTGRLLVGAEIGGRLEGASQHADHCPASQHAQAVGDAHHARDRGCYPLVQE
jgi:hypothetical protein